MTTNENGYINNEEEYYNQFGQSQLTEALKIALDVRKFEIELYWKRATYFWAFITTFFAGYTYVLSSDLQFKSIILIGISILGFIFSWGWYLVNRGSKYWQENWEVHVSLLTKKCNNPIFNLIKSSQSTFDNLLKSYPFSVSKVNQFLSLIIGVAWVCMFLYSIIITAIHTFNNVGNCIDCTSHNSYLCIFIVIGILVSFCMLLGLAYLMTKHTKSGHFKSNEINSNAIFKKI